MEKKLDLKNIRLLLAVSAFCGLLAACATTGAVDRGEKADFSAVTGKVWQLEEVETCCGKTIFERANMDKTKSDGFFTLQFEDGRASGKGAPNRFFGPYAAKADGKINFGPAAATLMMGIYTPPGLSEHEFFRMLNRAAGWEMKDNNFILRSTDEDGGNVTMIFSEFDYR